MSTSPKYINEDLKKMQALSLEEKVQITKARIAEWYTNGVGKKRGFEMTEVLIVPHGGSKNDTLCTVETKKRVN